MPAAGDTDNVLPVPTDVPPQEPLYHFQLAPVPKLPPLRLKVVLWPLQIVVVPLMLFVGTEVSLTVIVTLWQAVVLQVPSALI